MLQDLILLVNGEQPVWLTNLTEMTRSFGLELLETVLARFPYVFEKVGFCIEMNSSFDSL